jgi:serine/threonine protein kinase
MKNAEFIRSCEECNIDVISQLQESDNGKDHKSAIWLIRDNDKLFKVLKSITNYPEPYLSEDQIFLQLPTLSFIPKFYGVTEICGQRFLRRSFVRGPTLADNIIHFLLAANDSSSYIIYLILEKIKILLDNNLLFLDLKPSNIILTNDNDINLIDFGLSQFVSNKNQIVKSILSHPRYCAPENCDNVSSAKSIVFQLGIIAHELLTGQHPFESENELSFTTNWQQCIFRYLHPIVKNESKILTDNIVSKMLEFQPDDRPSLDDCIKEFENTPKVFIQKSITIDTKKTVLFPARMGIPHKGHIDYISGLIDLGYYVIISIQRSYTITDKDPISKWFVMKIVEHSLLKLGYSKNNFKFYFTPFYKTVNELKMHFAMMPDSFSTVVSSNPSIRDLFEYHDIIEQKDVLGYENEPFDARSWGEIIRTAIKNNDYLMFKRYAAIGLEDIITFKQIKEMYCKPLIEFVPGNVFVVVKNEELRVNKYSNPEETIIKHFSCQNDKIMYEYTEFDGTNEKIHFNLKEDVCHI